MRSFSKHAPWLLCAHFDVAAFLAKQAHEEHPLNTLNASVDVSLGANGRPTLFTCLPVSWSRNDGSRRSGPASFAYQLGVVVLAAAHAGKAQPRLRQWSQEAPPVWNQLPGLLLHIPPRSPTAPQRRDPAKQDEKH